MSRATPEAVEVVPATISDGDSIEAVFLILEDWSCEDISVADAYAAIIQAVARPRPTPKVNGTTAPPKAT